LLAPIVFSATGLRKPLSGLVAHAAKGTATTSTTSIEGTRLTAIATFEENMVKCFEA